MLTARHRAAVVLPLRAVFRVSLEGRMPEAPVDLLFAALDADGDGVITKQEMRRGLQQAGAGPSVLSGRSPVARTVLGMPWAPAASRTSARESVTTPRTTVGRSRGSRWCVSGPR